VHLHNNSAYVPGLSEVWWKGEGEIRSGDYTIYYSGGERGARRLAVIVHKGEVRSVIKKMVYSERIIAVKSKA
jgi:hypothetical protein